MGNELSIHDIYAKRWLTSHGYFRPDFVPMPLQVAHWACLCNDSFLQACRSFQHVQDEDVSYSGIEQDSVKGITITHLLPFHISTIGTENAINLMMIYDLMIAIDYSGQ